MRVARFGLALVPFAAALTMGALERPALANGFEIPENGTEVMGRGGAWVARADNPLAGGLNPAGLAGQQTGMILNANLTWQSQCFQKAGTYPVGADNGNTSPSFASGAYEGQQYPEVCKANGLKDVNPVPQLGFNYRVNNQLGIAFLPLWTPSGTGKAKWPTEVNTANGAIAPSPTRFMLVEKNARIIMPTLAAGYEVTKGVRFGLAFQWVITMFQSSLMSQGSQTTPNSVKQGPAINTMSEVSWNQWFTPAMVAGFLVSPHDDIDIGGMFRYSADIVKRGGDVTITAPYYGNGRTGAVPTETDVNLKEMRLKQPMDVRLGVRFHPARKGVELPKEGRRDFLKHDAFDIELDLTYSRNSSFDQLTILFDPNQSVSYSGAPGGFVPENASIQKRWKDTFGIRLGGEFNAIPEKLGVRAGGFFQTAGQDERYLNLDFHPGQMFGFYIGATARVTQNLDLSLGYGHIFVKPFDNRTEGGALRALIATPPDNPNGPDYYNQCNQTGYTQPSEPFRSCAIINTGRMTSGYNIVSLGGTYRF